MKKIILAMFALSTMCILTACNKYDSNSLDNTSSYSSVTSTNTESINIKEEELSHNKNVNILAEKLEIDGKDVSISQLSIQWLLDNDFTLITNNDYITNDNFDTHLVKPYEIEKFSFTRNMSIENSPVIISLSYINKNEDEKPFSDTVLYKIEVELGDESNFSKFEDISVNGPFGIKLGATVKEIIETLGNPLNTKTTNQKYFTTYEWRIGEQDSVIARIGDTMGLIYFAIVIN